MALDVQYERHSAFAAAILFDEWHSEKASVEQVSAYPDPAPYVPGRFAERELPPLLEVIEATNVKPQMIVIDGYVYLDGTGRAGLGKYLFDALDKSIPVVGVAKNRFKDLPDGFDVVRGQSSKPLYVTVAATGLAEAKANVEAMHGDHRIPTLLKRVDKLARSKSMTG